MNKISLEIIHMLFQQMYDKLFIRSPEINELKSLKSNWGRSEFRSELYIKWIHTWLKLFNVLTIFINQVFLKVPGYF